MARRGDVGLEYRRGRRRRAQRLARASAFRRLARRTGGPGVLAVQADGRVNKLKVKNPASGNGWRGFQFFSTSICNFSLVEPLVGFEPTTARLRIESSTPELQWHVRMPWRGFEPRRLSALPPQDSVSTSFTTRAR